MRDHPDDDLRFWPSGLEWAWEDGRMHRAVRDDSGAIVAQSHMRCDDPDAISDPLGWWWGRLIDGHWPEAAGGGCGVLGVVDLCSGLGALSEGLCWAAAELGWTPSRELAVDVDAEVLEVVSGYGGARRTIPVPVRDLPYIPPTGRRSAVVAGPPCQGFSLMNVHRSGADPRNRVYLDAVRWAIGAGADYVLVENVPQVAAAHEVKIALQELSSGGYYVTEWLLAADELGWCQARTRHFLAARRRELGPLATPPMLLRAVPRTASWGVARGRTGAEVMDDPARHGDDWAARIGWMHDTGRYDYSGLPPELRWPSWDPVRARSQGRMHPDRPSPTIVSGAHNNPTGNRPGHPTERRLVTLGEAAALQGLAPDLWRHLPAGVSTDRISRWIGNACPPPLAAAAAFALLAP